MRSLFIVSGSFQTPRHKAKIDPGPEDETHLAAILAEAGEISHILLTHPHSDHSALIPRLKAVTGAPVYAFGTASEGRSPLMQHLAAEGLTGGGEGLDYGFMPDHRLADGERLTGAGWALTAWHTPGHSAPHLAFQMGRHLFSGDLAMGWSSTLISPPDGDLGAYLRSTEKLMALGETILLPGHGDVVEDGAARLGWLAAHRRERGAQIFAALDSGPQTIEALTKQVYATTPTNLHSAAARNLFAHLIEMHEKALIEAFPALSLAALYARK